MFYIRSSSQAYSLIQDNQKLHLFLKTTILLYNGLPIQPIFWWWTGHISSGIRDFWQCHRLSFYWWIRGSSKLRGTRQLYTERGKTTISVAIKHVLPVERTQTFSGMVLVQCFAPASRDQFCEPTPEYFPGEPRSPGVLQFWYRPYWAILQGYPGGLYQKLEKN